MNLLKIRSDAKRRVARTEESCDSKLTVHKVARQAARIARIRQVTMHTGDYEVAVARTHRGPQKKIRRWRKASRSRRRWKQRRAHGIMTVSEPARPMHRGGLTGKALDPCQV